MTECHILLGIDFWGSVKEWLNLQLESLCCVTQIMQRPFWNSNWDLTQDVVHGFSLISLYLLLCIQFLKEQKTFFHLSRKKKDVI